MPTASLPFSGGASIQDRVCVTWKSLLFPLPLSSQPTTAGSEQLTALSELAKWCLWPPWGSRPAAQQCFSDLAGLASDSSQDSD